MPQTMFFYDQLPLLSVARSRRQAMLFSVASWVPPFVVAMLHGTFGADRVKLLGWNAPVIVWCYYLPCATLVLLRPNRGSSNACHAK